MVCSLRMIFETPSIMTFSEKVKRFDHIEKGSLTTSTLTTAPPHMVAGLQPNEAAPRRNIYIGVASRVLVVGMAFTNNTLWLLLLLALAWDQTIANECPNEPPLVGAHYMSNWHTGRYSQWRRCAGDAQELNVLYPERAPTTGLYHDMAGYYSFDGRAPSYPTCTSVHNLPNCNSAVPPTNRPCCDQYNCVYEPNNHMSCMGGSAAFPSGAFTAEEFDTGHPPGVETMRNEIIAAGQHGVHFLAVEIFGGVRGALDVTDPVTSPDADPFDSEMHLVMQNEDAMREHNVRWIVDIMNHGEAWDNAYQQHPEFWQEGIDNTVLALSSPSYLTICGRPVVLVGNGADLVSQAGGTAQAAALMDQLRAAIIDAGYNPPLLGSGFLPAGKQYSSTAAFESDFGFLYDWTNSCAPQREHTAALPHVHRVPPRHVLLCSARHTQPTQPAHILLDSPSPTATRDARATHTQTARFGILPKSAATIVSRQ